MKTSKIGFPENRVIMKISLVHQRSRHSSQMKKLQELNDDLDGFLVHLMRALDYIGWIKKTVSKFKLQYLLNAALY
jgi:hypothetical protein